MGEMRALWGLGDLKFNTVIRQGKLGVLALDAV